MPVIVGHDPSLASYGLALVEVVEPDLTPLLLGHAVITTSARATRSQRLRVLFDAICLRVDGWMERYAIDSAAFEAGFAFAGGGRGSDLTIAEARGVGLLACSNLTSETLAPSTIRLAVVGNGRAKKPEAIAEVCRIFGVTVLAADAADAAAVALAAAGYRAPRIVTTKQRTTTARSGTRTGGDRVPRSSALTKAG